MEATHQEYLKLVEKVNAVNDSEIFNLKYRYTFEILLVTDMTEQKLF